MSAMKRWLIVLVAAAVIIGGSTAAVFALTGEGNPTDDPQAGAGEPAGDQPPVRSDEGIDPDECNLVHNIDACDEEDLARLGGGEGLYRVTVSFNETVTQDNIDAVAALLR